MSISVTSVVSYRTHKMLTHQSSPIANDSFVEGLGAGQIVSRQALASPYLGDIQLSLNDRKGSLEVEVIRARRLQSKPGSRALPCK